MYNNTNVYMHVFWRYIYIYIYIYGFSGSSVVKTLPANAGDAGDSGSIHGLGRFPGGGTDNPL